MTALSRMLNCQFHALNKCFEIACTKTFGQTGLDKNNIFQATFVYCKMIKALKTFGGLEMVDEVHSTGRRCTERVPMVAIISRSSVSLASLVVERPRD